jgi:membrane protein
MAFLWSLSGLSGRELATRTLRSSWKDEVFGQSARLAFYYFLGVFPAFLLVLLLLSTFFGFGPELRNTLLDTVQLILPREASALVVKTIGELKTGAAFGTIGLSAVLSAIWAILNGAWAMMTGLNKAYAVQEERSWWRILAIAFVLTISLGTIGLLALAAMFYGGWAEAMIGRHVGLHALPVLWRVLQWLVIVILLLVSFSSLYRFGPNLKDRRWQWSIPGAVIALVLWVGFTLLLRISQDHFSSSQGIYAGLKPVVGVLLWLYLTGAAIFIGGEANSEIEKAAAESGAPDLRRPGQQRSGGSGLKGNA